MESLQKIKFIAIHHSGNSDNLEKIKNLHVNINGWEDIGYHYLVDKKGRVFKGRNEKFMGAHVLGHNRNSLGICLIGNLDTEKPSKKQILSLIQLLRKLMKKYKVEVKDVLGHKEFPNLSKTCPGKFIDLNCIRQELKTSPS